MTTGIIYKNPFFNPKSQGSQPEYTGDNPVEYQGYLIFERIRGTVWDVVLDGEIVSMRAGLNGAKKFVDERVLPHVYDVWAPDLTE